MVVGYACVVVRFLGLGRDWGICRPGKFIVENLGLSLVILAGCGIIVWVGCGGASCREWREV